MPHTYTNTAPVKPLDPLLPLADLAATATFHHRENGKSIEGAVIAQRLNKDNPTLHTRLFFVEFPAGSAKHYEVDMKKLSGILADGRSGSFNHHEVARILGSLPNYYRMAKLLTIAKP